MNAAASAHPSVEGAHGRLAQSAPPIPASASSAPSTPASATPSGSSRSALQPSPSSASAVQPSVLPPSPSEAHAVPIPISVPREHRFRLSAALIFGDWLIAFVAIYAGLFLREWQRTESGLTLLFPVETSVLTWSAAGSILFTWLMAMFKSYEVNNLYRMRRWSKNLLKSTALWGIVLWAYLGLFRIEDFSPRIGIAYAMVALVGLLAVWRVIMFIVMIQPSVREAAQSRIIVVGWNDSIANLRKAMRRDLGQLSEIIGCVPMPGGRFEVRPPTDLAVLGDYSDLPRLVRECDAHSILLAEVSCSSREIQHLIQYCQREMLRFQMVPQFFPALTSGLQVEAVSGVPLLGVCQLPLDRTVNRVLKRTLDIVGSLVGLGICAAILPWFALMVYLESPGPVIYRQRRTSRSGRTFYIYKIRSMKLDAEKSSGAVWCKKEDDRRLKIGAFMRKTNIDELPQFWNVLKGDMSLVGPRPERPELIAKFKNTIPNYNARHEVRSGLTGWAQVNGLRGDTDLTKRIEADLWYLENWSLWLDLHCLYATVIKNKNAY